MGKHWKQQVPASTWASPSTVTSPGLPCWGCSSMRKMDSGVPVKEFQGVYSKSHISDLHYDGTPLIGVRLGCLGSPQAKGHSTVGKSSTTSNQVHEQPGTWPTTTHGQITRHFYIHAWKSEVDKSGTQKTTDLLGDALQNQLGPCRHQRSKFLVPLRP